MTTADLLASGTSRAHLRTMVRNGDLISLGHGVYATAELAGRPSANPTGQVVLQALAVLATASPGSVASHHTAAQIHGLDLLDRPSALVAITRSPGVGSRSGKPGAQVHCAELPATHVGWRLAVPTTTVARTVIDLARGWSFRAGVVTADSALRRNLTSKDELRAVLMDCRRWRGTRRAAEVVDFADGLSESPLESLARVVFRDCGLPPPQLQALVGSDEGIAGRVDFLWPRYRTIAEVDGAMKYDNRSEAMYQLRRDARLREAGFEVVHFNWREITTSPEAVADSIRAAFRRGSRRPSAGPAA